MLDERARRGDEVNDLLETVKAYARQETIEPIRGGAKAAALGVAGVLFLGIGIIIILVATLRLLQTETTAFRGEWMALLPYLITFLAALACISVSLVFIRRSELDRGRR
jgi:hypothetical protein